MKRGGYTSSQRWHSRGGEERAWERMDRSSSSGGHRGRAAGCWGPSGQPSLPSKRSFWRPLNAHGEHQLKAVSQPDLAAVQQVQFFPATPTSTSLHQTLTLDELKLKDQEPPEEFKVASSKPVQLDHKHQPLQHQVPQHPLPSQQQQQEEQETRKNYAVSSQSNSANPPIHTSHAKPSEEDQTPIEHQQAVVPSAIQMSMGLPDNSVPQELDVPSVQQNQLLQQAMLHQGRETEETKLDKGTYSSRQMMALPKSVTQSKPVGNHSRMPWARGGYHAYRRQQKRPMLHKSNKKYIVAKLEHVKFRQLNAVLNKLTPQNFNIIFREVQEVNIDNVETLSLFVSQIHLRAVMEPTFCQVYAQLCSQLNWSLPCFNVDDRIITFKRLLLNNCQEGFERDERKEAEAGKAEDTEIERTQEEREEMITWAKRRYLGNIRFIGELCRAKSFPIGIIPHCIKKLLGSLEDPDEVKIEALCKLITATGEMIDDIDRPKVKEVMDSYFDRMQKLSTNQNLSWRVRFMLRDLIDLRKNKWKQRCEMTSVSADVSGSLI